MTTTEAASVLNREAAVPAAVDELDGLDFQQILARPMLAYEEGFRYLRGRGLMNQTLKQLAQDLKARGIDYAVIGATALFQHGYRRYTEDIDLLMTKEGLEQFSSQLVGRGYRPAFTGARKKFRATAENVPIEIIVTGEYPGDGKPKAIVFPDPADVSVEINGVKTISLEKLIELKLASGMSGLDRLKDLADVQELIRLLDLDADLAECLDESVRSRYLELQSGVAMARRQRESPDKED